MALPSEAIVNNGGTDFVFVRVNDRRQEHAIPGDTSEGNIKTSDDQQSQAHDQMVLQRFPVKKEVSEFGFTEISLLTDVSTDVQFMTCGAFFLMAKMKNTSEAHEH